MRKNKRMGYLFSKFIIKNIPTTDLLITFYPTTLRWCLIKQLETERTDFFFKKKTLKSIHYLFSAVELKAAYMWSVLFFSWNSLELSSSTSPDWLEDSWGLAEAKHLRHSSVSEWETTWESHAVLFFYKKTCWNSPRTLPCSLIMPSFLPLRHIG